jgi:shikimate dehydrogenase
MPAVYGLIGYPLTHSFSAGYFSKKFAAENSSDVYRNFPIEDIGLFPQLLAATKDLQGLNVTIPYKQKVIPFLDHLSDEARAIGAVNCIHIVDGKTKGYNTDVTGFRESLQPLLRPHHKQALILGTGGASLAVAYALQQLHIPFQKVSRTPAANECSYEALDEAVIATHTLIINTTPLGMFPATDSFPPIPYHLLTARHLLYDLVYNPEETLFLTFGKQHGATIKNGLEMLHLQADAALAIWRGKH